jgi:transcriptional regulator with XRE-family HTH domain
MQMTLPAPETQEQRLNAVDVHVGSRVRLRRTLLSLSQEDLARALGISFQQVQKYERGVNRIGASRLFDLAGTLDVPISFFFDAMPPPPGGSANEPGRSSPTLEGLPADIMSRGETLDLVRGFFRIAEPAVRKRVLELVKSLEAPARD